MPMPIELLQLEVLGLPTAERARLLDQVVASLDADSARDAAWDAVAAQRDGEIEADPEFAKPVDEVLARLRAQLP